jgi:iron complex transport system substrate-binding protein
LRPIRSSALCFVAVTSTGFRKVLIYLTGVLLGLLLLSLIPRKKEPREPHPWHSQTAPEGTYPMEVVDDYGRTVTFVRQPRWIVSLAPSATEMLFAMGMGDHLSAVTKWDTFPEEALRLRESGLTIGDLHQPDIERIFSLPADIVIGSKLTPRHVYERIQQDSRRVALAIEPESLDDLLERDLPLLGKVLGVPGKALGLVLPLRERRAAVHARLEAVRALPPRRALILLSLEDNLAPGWSPGAGTWAGGLLEEAHGENLAARLGTEWGEYPLEGLLAEDPEVIFFKDGESPAEAERLRARLAALPEHPVWRHLRAVREGRLVILAPGPLSIPGPRMVDALEAIAEGLWPETSEES